MFHFSLMRYVKVCLCVLFCLLGSPAFGEINNPQKIGIGTWEDSSDEGDLQRLESLKFSWYYDWSTTPLWSPNPAQPRTIPFVPMMWDETEVNETVPAEQGVLLGFNEPDYQSQAYMTVEQAITLWPHLMKTGLRLGSPATASKALSSTSWLGQFMSRAKALGYRVDFICLHYYSATGDVTAFKNYLTAIYNTYQKPIWVTEWALVDWSNLNRYTLEQNAAFARQALEMLDELPFVERHAWFALPPFGAHTELYDSSGTLTAVGKVFQQVLAGGHVPNQ